MVKITKIKIVIILQQVEKTKELKKLSELLIKSNRKISCAGIRKYRKSYAKNLSKRYKTKKCATKNHTMAFCPICQKCYCHNCYNNNHACNLVQAGSFESNSLINPMEN